MLLSFLIITIRLILSQINKLNFHVAVASTDNLSAVCSDTIATVRGKAHFYQTFLARQINYWVIANRLSEAL